MQPLKVQGPGGGKDGLDSGLLGNGVWVFSYVRVRVGRAVVALLATAAVLLLLLATMTLHGRRGGGGGHALLRMSYSFFHPGLDLNPNMPDDSQLLEKKTKRNAASKARHSSLRPRRQTTNYLAKTATHTNTRTRTKPQ